MGINFQKRRIMYLYGKRKNLNNFIEHRKSLWFRDINSLGKNSNEKICDNESKKDFLVNNNQIKHIVIGTKNNMHKFRLVPDKSFTMFGRTRRCHVLCLSKNRNDTKLFKKFKADVCIAIDVNLLEKNLRAGLQNWGTEIIGKEIKYYKDGNPPKTLEKEKLVFYKKDKYEDENEYRIAIFWPYDEKTIIKGNKDFQDSKSIFNDNPSENDHVSFDFSKGQQKIIIEVYKLKFIKRFWWQIKDFYFKIKKFYQ